jgi:hypothetical protein
VPTPVTIVDDPEELIRRIPADSGFYNTNDGTLRFSASAFNARDRMPSVDRRKMRASLDDCKNDATDGLVLLIAAEVRAIDAQPGNQTTTPNPAIYKVDVMHRPIDAGNADGLPANEAHSQIEMTPGPGDARFKKLKEALARLATKRGWLTSPVSS